MSACCSVLGELVRILPSRLPSLVETFARHLLAYWFAWSSASRDFSEIPGRITVLRKNAACCCYRPSSVVCRSVTLVSPAKTAEPINLPFGLWTRMGRRKHKFNRIHQVAPMCPHLVNITEPSVCGGNAALRRSTLTTCYY